MQFTSTAAFSDRRLAGRILKAATDNFVERPWGGTRLRELKGLCPLPEQIELGGSGIGESFEISAFDDDAEAVRYPTRVRLESGCWASLPELVRAHGEQLLGERWLRRHGRCIPLLPKFLNVRELLSVQGHPPGHTEAYIVVSADPGATIRLGFSADVDAQAFRRRLMAGRDEQRQLAELLGADSPWLAVQRVLADWFAGHDDTPDSALHSLSQICPNALTSGVQARVAALLGTLRQTYWSVLDSMNEIALEPGQVIHNRNPQRILDRSGRLPAAEVHALGNPEKREFVLLEVRRPGPTLRAWDNVRFPLRDVDIDGALEVLNLRSTRPEEFLSARQVCGDQGHTVSVDSPHFRIEHIDIAAGESFSLRSAAAHCLHVLSGGVELQTDAGTESLRSGESAFVPVGVTEYHGTAASHGVHLVRVYLP